MDNITEMLDLEDSEKANVKIIEAVEGQLKREIEKDILNYQLQIGATENEIERLEEKLAEERNNLIFFKEVLKRKRKFLTSI